MRRNRLWLVASRPMAEQAALGAASLTPNRQTQELEDGKPAASGIGKHFFVRFLPANPQPFRSDPSVFAHRWQRVDLRRFSSQELVRPPSCAAVSCDSTIL